MKIETEADYESAIDLVELAFQHIEYWQAKLDYWSRVVEEYEDIHYPIDKPRWWTRIRFRLAMKYKWLNWLLG